MDGDAASPRFTPCVKRRAYEEIVEQIEQAILTGALRPHDRLPSERDMLTRFGVSRPTIREALRVLQSRGLIAIRHGDPSGPTVTADPGSGMTSVLTALHRADQIGLADVIELRIVIESMAAAQAVKGTPEHIAAIRQAFDGIAASSDWEEMKRQDVLFHRRVAEATGNPLTALIVEALHQFNSVAQGLAEMSFDAARKRATDVHGEILRAIEAGDSAAAAAAVRRHLSKTYRPKVPPAEQARLAAVCGGDPEES